LSPPRAELFRRCDTRFDLMMEAGALDEVATFPHRETPLAGALGYRELSAYLAGGKSLAEAVAEAKQATRHYAKRQVTWFRHQLKADIVLEHADTTEILEKIGV
jgi:tRNA dimethylallyltransferase